MMRAVAARSERTIARALESTFRPIQKLLHGDELKLDSLVSHKAQRQRLNAVADATAHKVEGELKRYVEAETAEVYDRKETAFVHTSPEYISKVFSALPPPSMPKLYISRVRGASCKHPLTNYSPNVSSPLSSSRLTSKPGPFTLNSTSNTLVLKLNSALSTSSWPLTHAPFTLTTSPLPLLLPSESPCPGRRKVHAKAKAALNTVVNPDTIRIGSAHHVSKDSAWNPKMAAFLHETVKYMADERSNDRVRARPLPDRLP